MWQIVSAVREALKVSVQQSMDADPEAVITMRFLLHTDMSWEKARAIRRRDLDSDTGRVRWLHEMSGKAMKAFLPTDLVVALTNLSEEPDDLLLPFMSGEKLGPRVGAILLQYGAPLGLTEMPEHVHTPEDLMQVPAGMTRSCLDPWNNLEITSSGVARPCCKVSHKNYRSDDGSTLLDDMGSARRKAMQDGLLTGNLHDACKTCSIRKTVPLKAMQKKLEKHVPAGLRTPTRLRIELTTNCNLRCTYCPVTHPSYQGVDLPSGKFAEILEVTLNMPPNSRIDVNGHGETTFHPEWKNICASIIEQGHRPVIITNLAKVYDQDEIDLLSKFHEIQISLDSSDTAMMRNIRKSVTPDRILKTMQRIRDAAAGRRAPRFSISCGLYNPSVSTLPAFAEWIAAARFGSVTFWNLVPYEHSKLTTPLISLDGDELAEARANIATAVATLNAHGISYVAAGDFSTSDGKSLMPG